MIEIIYLMTRQNYHPVCRNNGYFTAKRTKTRVNQASFKAKVLNHFRK